mmetsp:Transcript_46193/g.55599  ORF Transcript_46193/g.55599 Transcript_46193/m.55599 type:complete len:169 (+) Transcript_46193:1291-1797(+)
MESTGWLVLDSIERMDGLERLVVIAVGLDHPIKALEGNLDTRSSLYRALTRAHLAVVVVNETVPGGWLEFLGAVRFDTSVYDDRIESNQAASKPANDVVANARTTPTPQTKQVDDVATNGRCACCDFFSLRGHPSATNAVYEGLTGDKSGFIKSNNEAALITQGIWQT